MSHAAYTLPISPHRTVRTMTTTAAKPPLWSLLLPLLSCGLWLYSLSLPKTGPVLLLAGGLLIGSVLLAVFHAEAVGHWVGEPLGGFVIALAVTIIEVSLIVSMMLSGDAAAATLARDTVFATVMIVCNGVVGLCLTVGALRHTVVGFKVEGTGSALAVLVVLTSLALVLPQFTTTTDGPTYSTLQLGFVGVMALLLYAVFVFVQTVRHREYFLFGDGQEEPHGPRLSTVGALLSVLMLALSLVAVIGYSKALAPAIQSGVSALGAPEAVIGIVIAMLVLLPETGTAVRAALRNRMQVSLNLALGSALATIGLTIPAVAFVAIGLDIALVLGLPPKELVLLLLTVMASTITLASGRATVLQGALHLVLFMVFLFLSVVP